MLNVFFFKKEKASKLVFSTTALAIPLEVLHGVLEMQKTQLARGLERKEEKQVVLGDHN